MLETLIKDLPINMIYDVNFISDDSTSGIINVIVIQRSLNRFLDGSQLLDGQSLLTGNFSH
jgi:hypothetical protein